MNREKLCALLIGVFPTHEIEDVLVCFELLPTKGSSINDVGNGERWMVQKLVKIADG